MKPFDPYEELGVGRDASEADVRRAYREKAKTTHPDSGGKAEDFDRARRAMSVLTDPAKRKKFDSTGTVDDGPDNTRTNALQVIEKFMSELVNAYIGGQGRDPRQMDVVAYLKERIKTEQREADAAIAKGEQVVEFLKDMAGRMTTSDKTGDPLAATMNAHIANSQRTIDGLQHGLACRKAALKIVSHYSFRWDQPTAGQGQTFSFSVRIG